MRTDRVKHEIILASASPRRKELLEQIGLNFTIEPSSAEEDIGITDPAKLVAKLSELKASDVFEKHPNSCIIAADTVVFANGKILGKPKDRAEGEQMLLDLSGKMHTVYTGLTVADKTGTVTDVSATDVYFKKLTKN